MKPPILVVPHATTNLPSHQGVVKQSFHFLLLSLAKVRYSPRLISANAA